MSATEGLDARVLGTLGRAGRGANGGGALIAFSLLAIVQAGDDIPREHRVELALLFVAVLGLAMVGAGAILTRHVAPVVEALRAGRPLTGPAWDRLFHLPARSAVVSIWFWSAAAVIFPTYSVARLGNSVREAATLAAVLALAGLTAGASMYLFVDRGLRPVYATAFASRTPRTAEGVAVGARLVLVWFVGSAVPLMITGLIMLGPDAGDGGDLRRDSLPWVVVGVLVGGALTVALARSLRAPLTGLRDVMAEVHRGHLAVRVDVDDATEVGLLQAGFNEMAAGLEERERLHDLFGRHVGTGVARRALERGVELGGELADASILFVDLIGSTSLAARLPPAAVVALLNDVFEAVVTATEREGGWVNKFEGDAALCVFGPPVGEPDHATRALQAARGLRRLLLELSERHPELDAGIGVSSGEVVAGNVGSERRFEYTVIGDPVNEAARLTELAKTREIRVLASGATLARAHERERRSWRAAGAEHLRGRSARTDLWEPQPAAVATRPGRRPVPADDATAV